MCKALSSRVLLVGVLMAFVVGVVGAISFAGGGTGPGGGAGVGRCECDEPVDEDLADGYCDVCGGCIPVCDGPIGPCECDDRVDTDPADGICDNCGGCIPDPVGDGPKGPR